MLSVILGGGAGETEGVEWKNAPPSCPLRGFHGVAAEVRGRVGARENRAMRQKHSCSFARLREKGQLPAKSVPRSSAIRPAVKRRILDPPTCETADAR